MKVVILAGGFGTRISEYTKTIPKPMIKINNKPLILLIMEHYAKYGFKDFYISIGYKGEIIKKYFKNKNINPGWNINLIETGQKTMTGGRSKKIKKYFEKRHFFCNIWRRCFKCKFKKLIKFHQLNNKILTLTAVRPPARFGAIKLKGNKVSYFKEKSKTHFLLC